MTQGAHLGGRPVCSSGWVVPFQVKRPYAVLMLSPIILVVYALAVARTTRMITADKIFERPRRAWIVAAWRRAHSWTKQEPTVEERRKALAMVMSNHADRPPLLAYLVVCPWCVSTWTGAVVAPLAWYWGDRPWLLLPALALAFSHVTGFLATREG